MSRRLIWSVVVAVVLTCALVPGLSAAAAPRASLSAIENDVMCPSCRESLAVAESPQAAPSSCAAVAFAARPPGVLGTLRMPAATRRNGILRGLGEPALARDHVRWLDAWAREPVEAAQSFQRAASVRAWAREPVEVA